MQRQTRQLAITALALVVLIGAAFGVERWYASGHEQEYRMAVTRDGKTLRTFTIEELQALGMKTVKMQGLTESGPTLLSVLDASGVETFTAVVVTGLGARDSGRIELKRSEIDDRVLLDIARRGTAKVCGPGIVYVRRVRDVKVVAVR